MLVDQRAMERCEAWRMLKRSKGREIEKSGRRFEKNGLENGFGTPGTFILFYFILFDGRIESDHADDGLKAQERKKMRDGRFGGFYYFLQFPTKDNFQNLLQN